MMKRFGLLCLCVLVAITLVLTSCQKDTAETDQTTSVTSVTSTTTTATTTPATQTSDTGKIEEKIKQTAIVPKYGGTLVVGLAADVVGFDPKFILAASTWTVHLTNERLTTGDWAKGPSGTGEEDWLLPASFKLATQTNLLLSSWELPDNETIILNIKSGIYFQNRPPANGREVDAYDVAYSIERNYIHTDSINYPKNAADRIVSCTANNKTTVTVKVPVANLGQYLQGFLVGFFIFPQELGLKGTVTKATDAIGTGPFMVTDHVRDSSVTMQKNPSYWRNDPVHPENRLPYTDYIRALVIADDSTRMAAIRIGKIDLIRNVEWDLGKDIVNSNPELNYLRYLRYTSTNIFMRMDKLDLPYKDIKVRRALFMGIDREGFINGYYGGNAVNFTHPILPIKALADMFVPLEEMPASVQENYTYNVAKAKQLLTEAGYPIGFKATIVCNQTHVDMLSVVKANWADINVELVLDVKETGTWTSIQRARSQADMLCAPITNVYYYSPLAYLYDQQQYNRSWGKDDYVENYYREQMIPLTGPYDDDLLRQKVKALVPYLAELTWLIPLPTPYLYALWQPWVGGYNGEASVGAQEHDNYPIYLWVDNDVKKKYQ